MPPEDTTTTTTTQEEAAAVAPARASEQEEEGRQSLYIVRHGDRWDYANPEWLETTTRSGDPPLSTLGHQQARETGIFLDSLLAEEGITAENITWLSSPFLRTLQTSNEALNAFSQVKGDVSRLEILPEYSVFEWDGKGGEWHASLPPLEERKHYFPRLNVDYKSLFVPDIPEPRSKFHTRCERAASALHKRFRFAPRTALVIVTHAAACIGLTHALCNSINNNNNNNNNTVMLQDITPAAPCSVYRLTRSHDTEPWTLDPHDAPNSLNGHSSHLSDLGDKTVPWNHFGDKRIHSGYTGPPNSRFAPTRQVRDEL